VTLDEANGVARKYARADQDFFVLGDRQKIEPQVFFRNAAAVIPSGR
jgi:hypothetical protein